MKIISGGQTGADEAGLIAAKMFGLETGGWMPDGFKTKVGDRPEFADKYGCIAMTGANYKDRTVMNAGLSDATIRFACLWNSPGEKCTMNAIKRYNKPFFDVDVINAYYDWDITDSIIDTIHPDNCANWISGLGVKTLNIAGNSNRDFYSKEGQRNNIRDFVITYLSRVFRELGYKKVENGV